MNIFLHKKKFLLFFLPFFYFTVAGQIVHTDTLIYTQPGEPVNYTFVQFRGQNLEFLKTNQMPANGQLQGPSFIEGSVEYFEYTYQPDPDFTGTDQFSFTRVTGAIPQASLQLVTVFIEVREPQVTAKQDIAFAMLDSGPIEIDVLENDETEAGELSVSHVPMVNNGTVSISPEGKVLFTPKPGFEGIASFNYNACNEYGVCDLTTVNVVVNGVAAGESDSLRIFTSINEAVPIITPADYNLDQSPENGSFFLEDNLPVYQPDNGFIGKDYITFSYGDFVQTIEVVVMNHKRNQFLVDDKAYVIPSKSVEIDIFANDDLGGEPCLQSFGQPKYGSLSFDYENGGILIYNAPAGFVGVDEFTYGAKTAGCQGETETATVYVYVSNFEPSAPKYLMTTPKMTPLVIGYYVPIQDFSLKLKEKPNFGEVLFLEGKVDTVILGRNITGHNLMIYLPHEGMNAGFDAFELTYCLSPNSGGSSPQGGFTQLGDRNAASSGCVYQKDVKIEIDILNIGSDEPMCFGDCIWSGDTNFDGVVNLEDLLPIGLNMGEMGSAREESPFAEWYGQDAQDWDGDNPTAKHIDTDGDGLISAADTTAIRAFFDRTHSMTNAKIPTYDYKVFLKGNSLLRPGDMMELEIHIGDEAAPAIDLYGFLFNLPYSTRFFKPETMQISFEDNSWITYNSPTLSMENNNQRGALTAAFTRTNRVEVSGFGKVAIMRGIVEDVILGGRDEDGKIQIDLSELFNASVGTGSGNNFGLEVDPFTLTIDLNEPEKEPGKTVEGTAPFEKELKPLNGSDLIMYPNPVRDQVNFHLNGGHEIEQVQLFDLNGRLVTQTGRVKARSAQLSTGGLQEGFYMARIYSEDGLISRKVKILRK